MLRELSSRGVSLMLNRSILTSGPVSTVSKCDRVKECNNNQCFFRRRDIFGISPWAMAYKSFNPQLENDDMDKKSLETTEKYGKEIFPTLDASIGTNCIYVTCRDFK